MKPEERAEKIIRESDLPGVTKLQIEDALVPPIAAEIRAVRK